MFQLSKDAARKCKVLVENEVKQALTLMLSDAEHSLVKQLNAGMSADQLLTTVAKIELLRNLQKFEQVIRTNGS
jgi:hypothetical protein